MIGFDIRSVLYSQCICLHRFCFRQKVQFSFGDLMTVQRIRNPLRSRKQCIYKMKEKQKKTKKKTFKLSTYYDKSVCIYASHNCQYRSSHRERGGEREREREGFIRSICMIFKYWGQPENVVIFSILLLK